MSWNKKVKYLTLMLDSYQSNTTYTGYLQSEESQVVTLNCMWALILLEIFQCNEF